MGQVTIYLDDELEAKMRAAAREMNLSQSKWIAALIEAKLHNEWPEHIKRLAGTWQNFPEAEEIRQAEGKDLSREKM